MATNTHRSQQGGMEHQDEGGVSRRALMHVDGDRYDELIQEDSNATILIQCSMHALLGISYLNRHV